jgi:hypothetical protein
VNGAPANPTRRNFVIEGLFQQANSLKDKRSGLEWIDRDELFTSSFSRIGLPMDRSLFGQFETHAHASTGIRMSENMITASTPSISQGWSET